MSALSIPVVTISDGVATTLSTNVAEFFGKLHKDVIRSIETILNSTDEKHQRNFAPMMIDVEIGNGAVRKSKAYRLTRDGFTFLAMGFTGERAQAFKWAYIDAFNRMEAQLHGDNLPQGNTLTPAQQLTIQQAVGRRAQKTANHYQTIYRAIKLRYQIAKYDQLPQSLFEDCLKFIETVDLHVPEAQTPIQETTTIPVQPQRDILTRTEWSAFSGSSMSSAICTSPSWTLSTICLKLSSLLWLPASGNLRKVGQSGIWSECLPLMGTKYKTWTAIST